MLTAHKTVVLERVPADGEERRDIKALLYKSSFSTASAQGLLRNCGKRVQLKKQPQMSLGGEQETPSPVPDTSHISQLFNKQRLSFY